MMSINSLNLSPVSMLLFSIFIICSTKIVGKCLQSREIFFLSPSLSGILWNPVDSDHDDRKSLDNDG